jgi:hypothetical protein
VAVENSYQRRSLPFGSERHITSNATEDLQLGPIVTLAIGRKLSFDDAEFAETCRTTQRRREPPTNSSIAITIMVARSPDACVEA